MDEVTARMGLPLLQPGQAQKEVWHNEALALLDLAVQAGVEAVGLNVPPASPAPGQAWIVGAGASGAWAGQSGAIAGWSANGWRFVAPREGMAVWSAADGCVARRRGGAWELGQVRARRVLVDGVAVVGPQAAAIPVPNGGASVDAESRAAIAAMLAALRGHGLIAS